ncbi:uncharacterized protein LOC142176165 [Nicotiana tabacum]|uniref:Uncharacterized protein LOC142176165 n=1 Tax=Nicotiana tabacum TaxID=4097 RepID=A0AC58TQ43_TOBAC
MSTLCTVGTSTGRATTFSSVTMVVHKMGDGYHRTTAPTPGKIRFFLNKTDYFSKLVEVGPYQKIGECEVVAFLCENIICKFEIPKEIACDNGPQFIRTNITKFFENLTIKRITSSPYHSIANSQEKSTNKFIIQNLKKRLEVAKGKWPEELSGVLWAYRTTAKSRTGETPFSLVYVEEALILVEVGEPTMRYFWSNEEANSEAMLLNLELLDERRDLAYIRTAAQKHRIERYCNPRANLHYFEVGDLVLRKVTQNTQEHNAGKLGPTWEGSCRVSTVTGKRVIRVRQSRWRKVAKKMEHGTPQEILFPSMCCILFPFIRFFVPIGFFWQGF